MKVESYKRLIRDNEKKGSEKQLGTTYNISPKKVKENITQSLMKLD